MKPIFEIFKTDIKQLYKSPLVLLIIIGAIFLAGVYAWLNVDSNWDPYGNTESIPIAVANEDDGANFLENQVNIGESLVEELADNNDIKWIFVDKNAAISGTESGKYYGAIIIPKDFTNKITTLLTESEIQKPTFDFYVNQKKNPIAPIIVNKVIGAVQTEIDQSFVNKIVYNTVNRAGILQIKGEATTSNVVEGLHETQDSIRQLKTLLGTASAAADSTSGALKSVQNLLTVINVNTSAPVNYDATISDLQKYRNALNESLETYKTKANSIIATAENLMQRLEPDSDAYQKLANLVEQLKTNLEDLDNNYSDKLIGLTDSIEKNLNTISNNLTSTKNALKTTLDQSNMAMGSIIDSLSAVSSYVGTTNSYLDGIIADIDKVIESVNDITKSELYLGLMNLLQNPPEVVADFIAKPIDANEIDVYSANSYGTKMAPFYTALASWVGCTILISILKTDVEYKIKKLKPYQKFWGRFIIFALAAVMQGIVISTGVLIIGVETQNDFLFVASMALISLVFITIVYPLVVTFGKIGAGIAVVILVLQVAGSGGTFPIELLPNFFQILQPLMPFTPALNMLREVIGGFYGNTYLVNLGILVCHTIIPLLIGLVFRKPIISIKERYGKKLEQSHLMGK